MDGRKLPKIGACDSVSGQWERGYFPVEHFTANPATVGKAARFCSNAPSRGFVLHRREDRLIELAQLEVMPRHLHQFQPIVRGPLFAIAGIAAMGVVACFYLVGMKVRRLFMA
jgi:hypothetical protein